jgi:hypothetical protein
MVTARSLAELDVTLNISPGHKYREKSARVKNPPEDIDVPQNNLIVSLSIGENTSKSTFMEPVPKLAK